MSVDAEKELLTDVGARIRQVRAAHGLNLEQLATLTGISAPALSLIETGKRDARLTTLARIAGALRVSINDLVGDCRGTLADDDAPPSSEGYDLGAYQ